MNKDKLNESGDTVGKLLLLIVTAYKSESDELLLLYSKLLASYIINNVLTNEQVGVLQNMPTKTATDDDSLKNQNKTEDEIEDELLDFFDHNKVIH